MVDERNMVSFCTPSSAALLPYQAMGGRDASIGRFSAVAQASSTARSLACYTSLVITMEFTFSLQKLAAYQPRQSQKSKATFETGLALLDRGGYASKGEEGVYVLPYVTRIYATYIGDPT